MAALDIFRLDLGGELGIRPLEEKDAAELFALIDASRKTLRDWLLWVAGGG